MESRVQVLTFRREDGDELGIGRAIEHIRLALAEFDGYVRDSWLTAPGAIATGTIIWDGAAALATFRHSELYARMALCPLLDGIDDRDFAIADPAATVTSRSTPFESEREEADAELAFLLAAA